MAHLRRSGKECASCQLIAWPVAPGGYPPQLAVWMLAAVASTPPSLCPRRNCSHNWTNGINLVLHRLIAIKIHWAYQRHFCGHWITIWQCVDRIRDPGHKEGTPPKSSSVLFDTEETFSRVIRNLGQRMVARCHRCQHNKFHERTSPWILFKIWVRFRYCEASWDHVVLCFCHSAHKQYISRFQRALSISQSLWFY